MYKKYCEKIIEPLLMENGYYPSVDCPLTYCKDLSTGIGIEIDIQKGKWYKHIRANIWILDLVNGKEKDSFPDSIESYQLGDFLGMGEKDIWWSVKKVDIDETFLKIEKIMKETLLPALKELEDENFVKDYVKNIKLNRELNLFLSKKVEKYTTEDEIRGLCPLISSPQ